MCVLLERFSAVSQTKFSNSQIFEIFKCFDKNTPVSPILVVIRTCRLKKGEQVKNAIVTMHEFVSKLL